LPNFFVKSTSVGRSSATRRRAPRPPTAGNWGTPEGPVVDVEDDALDILVEDVEDVDDEDEEEDEVLLVVVTDADTVTRGDASEVCVSGVVAPSVT
jgi:hypothetical protein